MLGGFWLRSGVVGVAVALKNNFNAYRALFIVLLLEYVSKYSN